ncbi:MAG: serine--tRNA ligase [Myxococcota bacterium]
MIDLKAFEKDPELFAQKLKRRGEIENLPELLKLVKERKALIAASQKLQEERNEANKSLGKAAKEEIELKRGALKELGQKIKDQEAELRRLEDALNFVALRIPNMPADDVPTGAGDEDNVEVRRVGTPREFEFTPLDHVELGSRLDIIDIERAAKTSGSRFAFLKGQASKLNRALIQYFCDFHTNLGDTELTPPYLVRAAAMVGVGQFPKFKEDVFEIQVPESEPFYLIPTAEVPVTYYHADEILNIAAMPMRYCAYSACFRAEAGSAGRDTRGLIRVHQFEKVEMVRFCTAAQAEAELDAMVARASQMLSELELPHRVVALCTGDIGFHSQKTYDLEVWLPAQNTFREISSCSSFGTFQARRAKIRYKDEQGQTQPVTTLNGSGLPLGRTLVAILENHQQADGSIHIPKVLQPYMGGLTCLT